MKYLTILVTVVLFVLFTKSVIADGNTISYQDNLTTTSPIASSAPSQYENKDRSLGIMDILDKLFWAVLGGLIGAFIALLLEKELKGPKLEIIADESANQDFPYPDRGRWKFFRVKVINKKLSWLMSLITTRETAQQLQAKITFKQISQTMKGRWAGTLELPQANVADWIRLANFPDPETIFEDEEKLLDVFVKSEDSVNAYGWNNEAYLYDWQTPHYELQPGDYDIEIVLIGLNTQTKRSFKAHIGQSIEDTNITM